MEEKPKEVKGFSEEAEKVKEVIDRMLENGSVTPSNIRNITGALKDVRELREVTGGSTLTIRIEGGLEWAE